MHYRPGPEITSLTSCRYYSNGDTDNLINRYGLFNNPTRESLLEMAREIDLRNAPRKENLLSVKVEVEEKGMETVSRDYTL